MATDDARIDSVPAAHPEDPAEAAARQQRRLKGIGPAIVALAALVVLALAGWGVVSLIGYLARAR